MGVYNGNEPYVFVSYSHKDSELVRPIIQGLQDRGFRVWYDEGIEVGFEWTESIAKHLNRSSCVLAFVSRNFDASHNCRREINFAIKKRKDPMVIYMEDEELLSDGMQMQLCPLHAMYLDRYDNIEHFVDVLSRASLLKPCLGTAAEGVRTPAPTPAKAPEPSAEELYQQARKLDAEKEYEKAFLLYKKAAEQGHAPAQNNLGYCYKYGEGVAQDKEEAVKWYRKSAEQGNAPAQHNLGVCYYNGEGVAQNKEEAVKWYRKSAEQGNAWAQFNLGLCYAHGEGVAQDKEEAVKWYRKSAEQGNAPAQYNLGLCYEYGSGVRKNKAEARKWQQKAADQGYAKAIDALKRL